MISRNNIMLVDDDEIFTYIIMKIIEESKLAEQINIFPNGREAMDFFNRNRR